MPRPSRRDAIYPVSVHPQSGFRAPRRFICSSFLSTMVDSIYRTRSLGVAAEGLPDQYADGKAARVWHRYIGSVSDRTSVYRMWLSDFLRSKGVKHVLDVACGTG